MYAMCHFPPLNSIKFHKNSRRITWAINKITLNLWARTPKRKLLKFKRLSMWKHFCHPYNFKTKAGKSLWVPDQAYIYRHYLKNNKNKNKFQKEKFVPIEVTFYKLKIIKSNQLLFNWQMKTIKCVWWWQNK